MLHTGSEKTRRARNRGARLREGDDPDLWSALSVRGGGARATRAEREREVCGPCGGWRWASAGTEAGLAG